MEELIKIGDLCKSHHITSRTLRYYEEAGLLMSHRNDNGYRSYDQKAVARLEQILFLRELRLSISQISQLLDADDAKIVVSILSEKLDSVNHDIDSLTSLKQVIEMCILLFEKKKLTTQPIKHLQTKINELVQSNSKTKNVTEVKPMKQNTLDKLSKHEVRIIKLPPLRVAAYRAESEQPENDAWSKLSKWKKENNINIGKQARQFGFNNPNPQEGTPVYGYEVWEVVDEDVAGTDEITIKQFEGGIYAVTTATADDPYLDISRRWNQLYQWVMDSEYTPSDHQWLEENLPTVFNENSTSFQLDLYFPIKK